MKPGQLMAMAVFLGICGCEHKDTPATVAPATQPAIAATADTSGDGGAAVTTKPATAVRDAGAKDAAVAAVVPPHMSIRALRALRANQFPRQPNGAPTIIERPANPAPATQKQ